MAALFGLVLVFGVRYKMAGTAKPGGFTELFDTALIVIGAVGVLTTLLWPRRRDPNR